MTNRSPVLALVATVLWAALVVGCSAGAHAVASAPLQVLPPPWSCQPGESSMVCCVKRFSLTPVESCGATMTEADQILRAMVTLMEAGDDDDDDFANNTFLPQWKQECIKRYVRCQNEYWTGSCYDCIRRCEGQKSWPRDMCHPR